MPPFSTGIEVGGCGIVETGRSWWAVSPHPWSLGLVSAAAAIRAAAPAPRAGRAFKALTGAGRDHRVIILAAAAAVAKAVAAACGGRAAAGGSPPGTHFWRLSLTAPAPEATRGSSLGIVLRGGGAWRVEQRRSKQHESPPFGVAALIIFGLLCTTPMNPPCRCEERRGRERHFAAARGPGCRITPARTTKPRRTRQATRLGAR